MDVLKSITCSLGLLIITGCQIPYLVNNAYEHLKIMNQRTPLKEVLKNPNLDSTHKKKLLLAVDARQFAEKNLSLRPTHNYTSYVDLKRSYITYLVMAAPKYQLKHHKWGFPFVGQVPYKGYYSLKEAKEEESQFDKNKYDTYVRGASAYSTLGWFDDPILSSMLRYKDHDLVETIIHETVHATLYIKDHADFNERLATYVGRLGTQLYYLKKEGEDSPTLKKIQQEIHDKKIFSEFISSEIKNLEDWYKEKSNHSPELKDLRIKNIITRFRSTALPKMKTNYYDYFKSTKLNNASLLAMKTYVYDLSQFASVYEKVYNKDFEKFLKFCTSLEDVDDPEKALKEKAQIH